MPRRSAASTAAFALRDSSVVASFSLVRRNQSPALWASRCRRMHSALRQVPKQPLGEVSEAELAIYQVRYARGAPQRQQEITELKKQIESLDQKEKSIAVELLWREPPHLAVTSASDFGLSARSVDENRSGTSDSENSAVALRETKLASLASTPDEAGPSDTDARQWQEEGWRLEQQVASARKLLRSHHTEGAASHFTHEGGVPGQLWPYASGSSSIDELKEPLAVSKQQREDRKKPTGDMTLPKSPPYSAVGPTVARTHHGATGREPAAERVSPITSNPEAERGEGPSTSGMSSWSTRATSDVHGQVPAQEATISEAPTIPRTQTTVEPVQSTVSRSETPVKRKGIENPSPARLTSPDGGTGETAGNRLGRRADLRSESDHPGPAWKWLNDLMMVEGRLHHLRVLLSNNSRRWGTVEAYVTFTWQSLQRSRPGWRKEKGFPPIPEDQAEIYRQRYRLLAPVKLRDLAELRNQIAEAKRLKTDLEKKLEAVSAADPLGVQSVAPYVSRALRKRIDAAIVGRPKGSVAGGVRGTWKPADASSPDEPASLATQILILKKQLNVLRHRIQKGNQKVEELSRSLPSPDSAMFDHRKEEFRQRESLVEADVELRKAITEEIGRLEIRITQLEHPSAEGGARRRRRRFAERLLARESAMRSLAERPFDSTIEHHSRTASLSGLREQNADSATPPSSPVSPSLSGTRVSPPTKSQILPSVSLPARRGEPAMAGSSETLFGLHQGPAAVTEPTFGGRPSIDHPGCSQVPRVCLSRGAMALNYRPPPGNPGEAERRSGTGKASGHWTETALTGELHTIGLQREEAGTTASVPFFPFPLAPAPNPHAPFGESTKVERGNESRQGSSSEGTRFPQSLSPPRAGAGSPSSFPLPAAGPATGPLSFSSRTPWQPQPSGRRGDWETHAAMFRGSSSAYRLSLSAAREQHSVESVGFPRAGLLPFQTRSPVRHASAQIAASPAQRGQPGLRFLPSGTQSVSPIAAGQFSAPSSPPTSRYGPWSTNVYTFQPADHI
ncbi:hypothetical protein CSUI_003147 [Cystoisospora suis]|uniref:Uncharacterized protein n=1 Tax=Cystoisospora suis TaxID=483139 RepID=A0A2C6L634_9APIC|nr:hypothetical protein CSUI_003147 [Cystoisospora suis]